MVKIVINYITLRKRFPLRTKARGMDILDEHKDDKDKSGLDKIFTQTVNDRFVLFYRDFSNI